MVRHNSLQELISNSWRAGTNDSNALKNKATGLITALTFVGPDGDQTLTFTTSCLNTHPRVLGPVASRAAFEPTHIR